MPEEYTPEEQQEYEQPAEDDYYAEKQHAELKRASHPRPVESMKFRSYEPRATTSTMPPKAVASSTTKPPVKKLFLGQKEIPLLRPPNHHNSRVKPITAAPAVAMSTTREPPTGSGIVAAQLTTATERQKKPSPYDTLREYLSIEDQIKKVRKSPQSQVYFPLNSFMKMLC